MHQKKIICLPHHLNEKVVCLCHTAHVTRPFLLAFYSTYVYFFGNLALIHWSVWPNSRQHKKKSIRYTRIKWVPFLGGVGWKKKANRLFNDQERELKIINYDQVVLRPFRVSGEFWVWTWFLRYLTLAECFSCLSFLLLENSSL